MNEFKQVKFNQEFAEKYFDGPSNRFARYFIYWQRGIGWLNEGRLYFYLIGGGVLTSKFIEVFGYRIPVELVIVGAVIAIPVIVFVGRWDLYKINKAREYVTQLHGSVTRYDSFNMAVLNIALMEAIAKKLGVDIEKLKKELNE